MFEIHLSHLDSPTLVVNHLLKTIQKEKKTFKK